MTHPPPPHACHADQAAGEPPLADCVLDHGAPGECVHAEGLTAREACPMWRPVESPDIRESLARAVAELDGLGGRMAEAEAAVRSMQDRLTALERAARSTPPPEPEPPASDALVPGAWYAVRIAAGWVWMPAQHRPGHWLVHGTHFDAVAEVGPRLWMPGERG